MKLKNKCIETLQKGGDTQELKLWSDVKAKQHQKDVAAAAAKAAKAQQDAIGHALASAVKDRAPPAKAGKGDGKNAEPMAGPSLYPEALTFKAPRGDTNELSKHQKRAIKQSAKALGMVMDPKAKPPPP